MPRRTPRTPEFDGNETSPEWGEVDKTFEAFVEAYADEPEGVDEWDDLSNDERRAIAARSLNGEVNADDFEDGVVLPVVNPATDNLSEPGLLAAQRFTSRTEGIDARATERKIESLLAEHFDHESGKNMTPDPDPNGQFEKRVELLEKDEDEQTVTAAALVPDRLDHQGDFLRAETIRELADGYAERFEAGEVYPGVMHSVFPDDGIELVESRVLDEATTVGEKDLPAGSWLQRYQIGDDELWTLVDDGVLGGVSIGGTAKGVIYEPGAMPDDVEIPEAVQAELDEAGLDRDDIMVREITDGRIMETSQVDYPAVPDAVHAEAKALEKASPALTENVVAARLYLEARGHDPDDARRLAEYLQETKGRDGGFLGRAKSFFGFGGAGGGEVQTSGASDADAAGDGQSSDERAESRAGADESTTDMSDDELNDKLEALETRLDDIDAKLSEDAGGDGGAEEEKTTDDDTPDVEEKLDRLAEATIELSETVDEMASAQGVSQQADTGTGNGESKDVWGKSSPFAPGQGGDA